MSSRLDTTLATFDATIHRTKNRLVAIPARVQREVGLERGPDNHIVRVSIRRAGSGRWNHHYFKLTGDNEFSIPSDIVGLAGGDRVEVKIHAIIPDAPVAVDEVDASATGLLLALAARKRPGWRTDGATRLDEYLAAEARSGG